MTSKNHRNALSAKISMSAWFTIATALCRGQVPNEPAPPAVAAMADSRARKFLQDVARLSPMPAGTNADRAQMWPRAATRIFRLPDGTEGDRSTRVLNPSITAYPYADKFGNWPAWLVEYYGGEIKVTVDAASGKVLGLVDGPLMNAICRDPAAPVSKCLAQSTALSRTISYLTAAGLAGEDLALTSGKLTDSDYPPTESSRKWVFVFSRMWKGVQFDGQFISVSLDARHGRLIGFGGVSTGMPPPAEARLAVTAEHAGEIATHLIESKGYSPNADLQIELKIVQPDNYWTSPRYPAAFTEQKEYTRLAWVVRILVQGSDNFSQYAADVRIDAATGDVIGGDMGGLPHMNPPHVYGGSIGTKLRSSKRLEARRLTHGKVAAGAVTDGVETLDPSSNELRFYGALAGVRSFSPGMEPKTFDATHRLTVLLAGGKTETFEYDLRQGLIRSQDVEVVQAGAGLRSWLNPLVPLARDAHGTVPNAK